MWIMRPSKLTAVSHWSLPSREQKGRTTVALIPRISSVVEPCHKSAGCPVIANTSNRIGLGQERKVNYAEEENYNVCSGMSHCWPADGSGVQRHVAHVQGSERMFREGRFDDNSGVCAGRVRPCPSTQCTHVCLRGSSIVMQVKGGKEVTLTPGQTFYEGPNDVHVVSRNASNTKPAKFLISLLRTRALRC